MNIKIISTTVLALAFTNTFGDAKYSTSSDPMTDNISYHVEINANNNSSSLMFDCFLSNNGYEENIKIYLYVGNTVDDDYPVTFRVDKNKAKKYYPDSSPSLKQLYIVKFRNDKIGSDKETIALIDEIKSGSKLLIKYFEWPGQVKYATYNLSGSESAINKIEYACKAK